MDCKICSSTSQYFKSMQLLNKYTVKYYICDNCGFLQTEEPFWLDEAYNTPITKNDVGLLHRNISVSKLYNDMISTFFDKTKDFIDYGGGYGIFVRLMRDLGINFYWYDLHVKNLFAYGYDADISGKIQYEVLTAIEVFEHLKDPLKDIEKMLKLSPNILLDTLLIPEDLTVEDEWWYYGLDHGQHISFFSLKTLEYIANKYNLLLYSNGETTYLLTSKKISNFNEMFKKEEEEV